MPEVKDPQIQPAVPEGSPDQPAPQAAPAAPQPVPAKPPQKKKAGRKKMVKRMIALSVVLALVAGIGFGMWYLVFRDDETIGQPLTAEAQIGTIQSTVEGNGNAVPKESAAITLNADGTVQEVYVTTGDQVWAGDPLYQIDSQEAREKLENLTAQMNDLLEEANNLTVTAPFSGKLIDVQEFQPDQEVSVGTKIATLVNDRKLKLSLYFSYAYEDEIHVGQSVQVSVPAVMSAQEGTVEKINKVSYISPEGAVHFEAVIVFDNPGTLTADMDASAVLTASDGSSIYPYENGQTQFYETRDVLSKASGPVVGMGNLLNHANVSAGEGLLFLGSDTIDDKLAAKREELDTAQTQFANFEAVAPIDGVVMSCTLEPGMDVKSGDTVITISNTTTMLVDIQVDSRNIGFIQAGMTIELTDDWGNPVMGTVANVPMQGEVGSGTTMYPVQLQVDNSGGTIYNGSWMRYKLVTSESVDCVMVPNQCVKRVTDVDGEIHTVVFVQADSKPENAIEMDAPSSSEGAAAGGGMIMMPEGSSTQNALPTTDEGFWPVPVVTGISDTYNVEIVEGLEAGAVVFTNRETNQSYGW